MSIKITKVILIIKYYRELNKKIEYSIYVDKNITANLLKVYY